MSTGCLPSDWELTAEIPAYGRIVAYASGIDGVLVVEIDTPEASAVAGTADLDTVPRIRVYINDNPVWEHPPCPEGQPPSLADEL